MNEKMSRVYAKVDEKQRIIAIDGGYTINNIKDFTGWVLIDEGIGERYNLCQNSYLDKPIIDERGVYQYKLEKTVYPDVIYYDNGDVAESEYIDYDIVERSAEEMASDYDEMCEIVEEPTQLDKIEAQAFYTALLTGTLLEDE